MHCFENQGGFEYLKSTFTFTCVVSLRCNELTLQTNVRLPCLITQRTRLQKLIGNKTSFKLARFSEKCCDKIPWLILLVGKHRKHSCRFVQVYCKLKNHAELMQNIFPTRLDIVRDSSLYNMCIHLEIMVCLELDIYVLIMVFKTVPFRYFIKVCLT